MFLISATKKGFSAKEMQKQLGLKRYEPVWQMTHKLRKVMGERDAAYTMEQFLLETDIDDILTNYPTVDSSYYYTL